AAQPSTVLPRAAEPVEIAPVPDVDVKEADAPLTRRQMRALEHARSVAPELEVAESEVAEPETAEPVAEEPVADGPRIEPVSEPAGRRPAGGLVSGVPTFDPAPPQAAATLPRFDVEPKTEAEPGSGNAASDRDQVAAIFDAPV